MTLNVQGAAATPWPDPTMSAAAVPGAAAPAHLPPRHELPEPRRVEASAPANSYDALRVQAYRRDAAEAAATLGTQSAPTSSTASTTAAPAVKVSPPLQVNPVAVQSETPYRAPAPQPPPAIRAPEAIDEQVGARGS